MPSSALPPSRPALPNRGPIRARRIWGNELYNKGKDIPSLRAVGDQVRASCVAIPGYALLPTVTEWLIENGYTIVYPRISSESCLPADSSLRACPIPSPSPYSLAPLRTPAALVATSACRSQPLGDERTAH